MKKKGEMTTQQIVMLIILIASFAVLLFFLVRLNLGEESEKDVCHNSVVTRGSSVVPTGAVPLDCSRTYVCISKDGSCEKMTNPQIRKVSNKEDIYGVLAEEMRDCWWMYGEGKVDYIGSELITDKYCSICSQIAFDDSVMEIIKEGSFDKREFYQHLILKNMTGTEKKYSEYLYRTNNISQIYSGEFGSVNLDDTYYIMMAITSKTDVTSWGIIGGVAVGAIAVVTAPVSVPFGVAAAIVVGAGATGGYLGYSEGEYIASIVTGESGNEFMSPALVEANSEDFKNFGCYEVTTKA